MSLVEDSVVSSTGSCIYGLHNLVTDRWYVGQTVNARQRWYDHSSSLRRGAHKNGHLQRSWGIYGEGAFVFVVLEDCPTSQLTQREQYWIDYLKAYTEGYNNAPAAECPARRTWTLNQRSAMSQSRRAYLLKHPEELDRLRKMSEKPKMRGGALTRKQAGTIRKRNTERAAQLAKEFGCSRFTVYLIRQDKIWVGA